MITRRQSFSAAALGMVTTLFGGFTAIAQPANKIGKIIVPFPAGGGTDAVARLIADKIRSAYPAGVVVDNRPGASGRLGVNLVKDAEPDGSTMLFTPDFLMTVYPHSFRRLGYNPLVDLAPVAVCAKTGYAVAAGPGLPASITTIQQFAEWCRANPGRASFASTSAGSTTHFLGLMLSKAMRTEILHVPYKGGAPALQDLMAGQVTISINPIGELLPQLKGGRIRALATTGAQRSRFLPEVQTLSEAGFDELVVDAWLGMFMPRKTPAEIVNANSKLITEVVQIPDVRVALSNFGMDPVQSTPAAFGAVIKSDLDRWGPIIKASGFSADE